MLTFSFIFFMLFSVECVLFCQLLLAKVRAEKGKYGFARVSVTWGQGLEMAPGINDGLVIPGPFESYTVS